MFEGGLAAGRHKKAEVICSVASAVAVSLCRERKRLTHTSCFSTPEPHFLAPESLRNSRTAILMYLPCLTPKKI